MNKQIHNFRNSIQLAGAIFSGLLIGLPAILQTAQAQQQPLNVSGSKINPCPKIFYEEPHNNRVRVPQGCPPNAFTNRINTQGSSSSYNQTQLGVGGEAPDSNVDSQSSNSQTIIQNSRNNSRIRTSNRYENAVAAVSPTDGKVSVLLVNQTNAPIVYQAIGDYATGFNYTCKCDLLPSRQRIIDGDSTKFSTRCLESDSTGNHRLCDG
jgi:hypothetical protein